jgi:hypothetical protein
MDRQVVKIVNELVEVTGEFERCHRARRWIFNVLPYLARQLSVFNRLPTEGYTQDGKF